MFATPVERKRLDIGPTAAIVGGACAPAPLPRPFSRAEPVEPLPRPRRAATAAGRIASPFDASCSGMSRSGGFREHDRAPVGAVLSTIDSGSTVLLRLDLFSHGPARPSRGGGDHHRVPLLDFHVAEQVRRARDRSWVPFRVNGPERLLDVEPRSLQRRVQERAEQMQDRMLDPPITVHRQPLSHRAVERRLRLVRADEIPGVIDEGVECRLAPPGRPQRRQAASSGRVAVSGFRAVWKSTSPRQDDRRCLAARHGSHRAQWRRDRGPSNAARHAQSRSRETGVPSPHLLLGAGAHDLIASSAGSRRKRLFTSRPARRGFVPTECPLPRASSTTR